MTDADDKHRATQSFLFTGQLPLRALTITKRTIESFHDVSGRVGKLLKRRRKVYVAFEYN